MIAISSSDFEKFGCVNCGCDFVYNVGDFTSSTVITVKCAKCGAEFTILTDGTTSVSHPEIFNPDILDHDDKYTLEVREYPRKGKQKKISTIKIVEGDYGMNAITKEAYISYFVKDVETGKHIIGMFDALKEKYKEKYSIRSDCKCFLCGKQAVELNNGCNPLDIRVNVFACNKHERLLSETSKIIQK